MPLFGLEAFLSRSSRRLLQRIFTKDLYYCKQKDRFDNAMLLTDDDSEDYFGMCFARGLCLLQVCQEDDWRPFLQQRRQFWLLCSYDTDSKLRFLQYYELLEESKVALNEIDKCLNCRQLR